jgi:DNA repair protein RadC
VNLSDSVHKEHRKRLREQFLNNGFKSLTDYQKLELILFYSIPVKDTNVVAHRLIEKFGSISGVFDAPFGRIVETEGVGENSATLIKLFGESAKAYLDELSMEESYIRSTADAADYIRYKFLGKGNETMLIVCLDSNNRVIHKEFIQTGGVDTLPIRVRQIGEIALGHYSKAIVLAHNHTNGIALPSRDDIEATRKVVLAMKPFGIVVLDSLVISDMDIVSLAESAMYKDVFK